MIPPDNEIFEFTIEKGFDPNEISRFLSTRARLWIFLVKKKKEIIILRTVEYNFKLLLN